MTKHLESMEDARLVRHRWPGREKIWELDLKLLKIAKAYLEKISSRWDDALEKLKELVEE